MEVTWEQANSQWDERGPRRRLNGGRERRRWAESEVGETDDAPSTSGAVPLLGELQDGAHAKRNRRDVQSIPEGEKEEEGCQ